MIKVYVHQDAEQQAERFECSDDSAGEAVPQKMGNEKVIDIDFSKHSHPSFWVTMDRFKTGQKVNVDVVTQKEQFQLNIE